MTGGGDIYRTARLSPTSLRYYGLCLRKGSYKVTLHFAEIGYSDDITFSSLGRRYFDVSIQVSDMPILLEHLQQLLQNGENREYGTLS